MAEQHERRTRPVEPREERAEIGVTRHDDPVSLYGSVKDLLIGRTAELDVEHVVYVVIGRSQPVSDA
jgi:hypothetical protein